MDMAKFLENPHEFARLYPITTSFGSSVLPGEAMKQKNFDVGDEAVKGYQIKSENRILWFRLQKAQSTAKAGSSELMLSEEQEKEDYLPTYWLPWSENQIYRITLRPGRNEVNHDPDYFFTAPVNGCSVFVEGPPEQPTVYHANAQTHGGDYNVNTAKEFKRLQRQKAEHMRERYLAFSRDHEKKSRGGDERVGPGTHGREVNTTHYFSRAFHPSFQDELEEVVDTLLRNTKGRFVIDKDRVTVTDVEGTVFGVREKGAWTFYFQKRVYVEFYVNQQKLEKSKQSWPQWGKSWLQPNAYSQWWTPNWLKGNSWMTLTCAQFWPDGGGQAVVRI